MLFNVPLFGARGILMVKGRIAVLTAQSDEAYQRDFLMGVEKCAFEAGYDVCIFSMYIKYQNTPERERGEATIYTLINYDLFDAVIVMADCIQTPDLWGFIEEDIHERFAGPVILVDMNSKYFKSFWTHGYKLIYKLISHLIEEHDYKDILFIAGKKWHEHTVKRVEAYKDAMSDHNLKVTDDMIFYGDYWYTSGEVCAEEILDSGRALPDAVACANDCMAIGFAKAMEKRGIRIPEDIAVTGYGTSKEGWTSPSPLTSVYIPAEYYGTYAVNCLFNLMNGEEFPEKNPDIQLYIGGSCGCKAEKPECKFILRDSWETNESEENFNSIHNFIQEDIMKENSKRGYLDIVYSYLFQIGDIKSFYLCLNDNEVVEGYSDEIIQAIKYEVDNEKENSISLINKFSKKDILPALHKEHSEPRGYIFTPVYNEDNDYGYAVLGFGSKPMSYDSNYRMWINSVSRGYEVIRRNEELINLRSKVASDRMVIDSLRERKKTVEELNEHEKILAERVETLLDQNLFKYYFQPIVNAKTGEIYSYEALMRSELAEVNPLVILKYSEMLGRLVDVERNTFKNIITILENNIDKIKDRKIFINSIPSVELEKEERKEIIKRLSFIHDNVVVEVTESAQMAEERFNTFKDEMKENDINIALDDYGTGYSNISNLLRYMPKYVKVDRSLISNIEEDLNKQYFVREVVDFCHESDILALAEGVENYRELETVINLGVDLIQGFYTAKPNPEIIESINPIVKDEILKINQENSKTKNSRCFASGRSNRISLNGISKEGYNRISISGENVTYRDVTIVGTPGHQTEVNIMINDGYCGIVTLENATLFSVKGYPCIQIGEDCDVTIILKGDNSLKNGGILVPQSSVVTFKGDGDMFISISHGKYYGIGNSIDERCGTINFHQDGSIKINASGRIGVGIGSGLGGRINIERGGYHITLNGEQGVGIGSLLSDIDLDIKSCDMSIDINKAVGVGIGSMDGNSKVSIIDSAVGIYGNANKFTAIGTIRGNKSYISLTDVSVNATARSKFSTLLGALEGATKFKLERGKMRLENNGERALIFGGHTEDTQIYMKNFDCYSKSKSDLMADSYAKPEKFILVEGKGEFYIDSKLVERNISQI